MWYSSSLTEDSYLSERAGLLFLLPILIFRVGGNTASKPDYQYHVIKWVYKCLGGGDSLQVKCFKQINTKQ